MEERERKGRKSEAREKEFLEKRPRVETGGGDKRDWRVKASSTGRDK